MQSRPLPTGKSIPFSERACNWRTHTGMSLSHAATKIGIQINRLKQIEQGDKPTGEERIKLMRAFLKQWHGEMVRDVPK